MRFTSYRNLERAARRHPSSMAAVERWFFAITRLDAPGLVALRKVFPATDQVGNTLVFNIGGNNFRLLCCVDWLRQWLFFRALLTHAEYDRTNVEELCP
ncbi:MAG: type II toxin-antitoxin system HigB family toxin [Bryobacteraceae bacterium]